MPACSQIGILNESAARCAEVVVTLRGLRRSLYLGGVAKAFVHPPGESAALEDVRPGDELRIEWEDVFFYGEDSIIGPVEVTLREPPAGVSTASTVHSIAPTTNEPKGFFPANNQNSFWFRIRAKRFGLDMQSDVPLKNEATISEIPPWKSVYALAEGPVRFRSGAPTPNLFSSISSAVAGDLRVESCRVKLMELEGIGAELSYVGTDVQRAEFDLQVENKTTEDTISATWTIWPRPEEDADSGVGTLEIGRDPIVQRISITRDIFFSERWLAIAVTKPFETDGAFAARFPSVA